MDEGIFGTPIDTETLRGMPRWRIQRADRAQVARDLMNAEGNRARCLHYVETLSGEYGYGVKLLCIIYNATGDDLTFSQHIDFHGHIYKGARGDLTYPRVIRNGQWAGFLHVHPTGAPAGSSAAVVYSGLNNDEVQCDWMLSWSNPWWTGWTNKVYTKIREAGYYNNNTLGNIENELANNGADIFNNEWNRCTSRTTIGPDTTTIFEGIMSLTPPPVA